MIRKKWKRKRTTKMAKKISYESEGPGQRVTMHDIIKNKDKKRSGRVGFLLCGILSIIFTICSSLLTTYMINFNNHNLLVSISYLVSFVLGIVLLFCSIRFYGKENCMYKSFICSYLIITIFNTTLSLFILGTSVYFMFSVLLLVFCIWAADKLLSYIWKWIGDRYL